MANYRDPFDQPCFRAQF